ncbi:MAG: methyl-accepting chemotaxis protein [Gammaproteobacteria bacterium]
MSKQANVKSTRANTGRAGLSSDALADIVSLADGLRQLAQGYTDVELHTPTATDDRTVASLFDSSRRIRELLAGVTEGTRRVQQCAGQSRTVAAKLDESVSAHAIEIGHASADAREIAASIEQLRDEFAECFKKVMNTMSGVKRGQSTLAEVTISVDAIRDALSESTKRGKRLAEAAQSMSDISREIDDLSQQANVLAVNASIRAHSPQGDSDNFGALSAEIRRLADQAADTGRGVEDMVREVIADAAEVVRAGEEANAKAVSSAALAGDARRLVRNAGQLVRELQASSKRVGEGAGGHALQVQQLLSRICAVESSSTSLAAAAKNACLTGNHLTQVADVLQHCASRESVSAADTATRTGARVKGESKDDAGDQNQEESSEDSFEKTMIMDPGEIREHAEASSKRAARTRAHTLKPGSS